MSALTVTASEIHTEHEAAQRCAAEAVAHAIRAGELLLQVKADLPHGAFGAWLTANVEFSDRTARGYMQLASADPAIRQRVAVLSLRQALAALARPRQQDDDDDDDADPTDEEIVEAAHAIRPGDPEADPLEMLCFWARRIHGCKAAENIMSPEGLKLARRGEAFVRARLICKAAP